MAVLSEPLLVRSTSVDLKARKERVGVDSLGPPRSPNKPDCQAIGKSAVQEKWINFRWIHSSCKRLEFRTSIASPLGMDPVFSLPVGSDAWLRPG